MISPGVKFVFEIDIKFGFFTSELVGHTSDKFARRAFTQALRRDEARRRRFLASAQRLITHIQCVNLPRSIFKMNNIKLECPRDKLDFFIVSHLAQSQLKNNR